MLKLWDPFTLECGSEGKLVWISPDTKRFFVVGVSKPCRQCGKKLLPRGHPPCMPSQVTNRID